MIIDFSYLRHFVQDTHNSCHSEILITIHEVGHYDQAYSQWYYQYRRDQLNHDGAKPAEEINIGVINERTSDLRRKDKRVAAERLITEPGPLIDRNWSFIAWYLSGNWPLLISAREFINIQSPIRELVLKKINVFFRALSELPLLPLPPILVTCTTFPTNSGRKTTFFFKTCSLM